MAFAYYAGRGVRAPRSVLPAVPWSKVRPYVEDYATLSKRQLSTVASQCKRLWFVSSHQGQPSGPAGSRANYARSQTLRGALAAEFAGEQPAVRFGYAAPVRVQLFAR